MKRHLLLIMALGLTFSLAACTNPLAPRSSDETEQEERNPGEDEGSAALPLYGVTFA